MRRDRLRGRRFTLASGVQAEVRRSCRDELKVIYEGACFDEQVWKTLAALGVCERFEASRINPRMKDLFRVRGPGFLLEGACGANTLQALYLAPGRLKARHRLEAALNACVKPLP